MHPRYSGAAESKKGCASTQPLLPPTNNLLGEFQQQVPQQRYVAMKSDCGADFFKDHIMAMQRYKNCSGQSNVHAFELLDDAIIVQFKDYSQYTYRSIRVGARNLMEMKQLATGGQGLNSFINQNPTVRNGYTDKIKGVRLI